MSTEIINTIDYNYPLDRYERDALYGAYLAKCQRSTLR